MQLEKLTPKELGELFPISISEPMPVWPELYRAEKIEIEKVLEAGSILRIEHIGSTAVPHLKAKPTIDILLEISETADQHELENRLIHLNYRSISKPDNPPPHLMFVKGYTDSGFRGQAYHLHVRYYGDWDEPFFRDYLILHPAIAHEYEILKLHLVALYKNDRDAYTYGKTDFIKRITKLAREEKDQR